MKLWAIWFSWDWAWLQMLGFSEDRMDLGNFSNLQEYVIDGNEALSFRFKNLHTIQKDMISPFTLTLWRYNFLFIWIASVRFSPCIKMILWRIINAFFAHQKGIVISQTSILSIHSEFQCYLLLLSLKIEYCCYIEGWLTMWRI